MPLRDQINPKGMVEGMVSALCLRSLQVNLAGEDADGAPPQRETPRSPIVVDDDAVCLSTFYLFPMNQCVYRSIYLSIYIDALSIYMFTYTHTHIHTVRDLAERRKRVRNAHATSPAA